MENTLSERVKWCMNHLGMNNNRFAKACGVAPPTSFNWMNGRTHEIKAGPVGRMARLCGVEQDWINFGKQPKFAKTDAPPGATNIVTETARPVYSLHAADREPMAKELLDLFSRLDASGKTECLHFVNVFVAGRHPHTNGQDLQVAYS